MERRIVLFLVLSVAILVGNFFFQAWLRGPQPPVAAKQDDGKAPAKAVDKHKDTEKSAKAANDKAAAGRWCEGKRAAAARCSCSGGGVR